MKGRKPIPFNLRVLHGNPSRRPLPEKPPEPKRGKGLPRAPKAISPAARKHWLPLVKQLDEANIMTSIDATAMMLLCEAYAVWEEATANLRQFGLVIRSPNGYPAQSPYLSIANRAQEQMAKMLAEFGMTPSSRMRVAKKEAGEGSDAVANRLFGIHD